MHSRASASLAAVARQNSPKPTETQLFAKKKAREKLRSEKTGGKQPLEKQEPGPDGPKKGPDGPKTRPEGPKAATRRAREAAKRPQDGPKRPKEGPTQDKKKSKITRV